MTSSRLCALASVLLLFLSGCSTAPGGPSLPKASAGFVVKQSYAGGQEKLWDATLLTLEKNRIGVATSDKGSGTLQTDYLEAPTKLVGMGLLAAHHFRYKYSVSVRPQADGTSRLSVLAKVETYMSSADGSTQWTDIGSANGPVLKNLEAWLYEQIEKELPKS